MHLNHASLSSIHRQRMSFTELTPPSAFFRLGVALIITFILSTSAVTSAEDAVDRLQVKRLQAVQQARTDFAAQRKAPERTDGYQQHRANLHVHSHFSHDSRGQLPDIIAAAKKAGTSILMFTEHPAEHYDFFRDGHRGLSDGILLIPGAEQSGFLVYPTFSLEGITTKSPQELADLVRGRDGQIFVSHLEERMDWQINGISGTEIYNTHADFKEEKALVATLRNPLKLFQLSVAIQKYPQECFGAIQNYPADYLRRFDQLCQTAPHTGVAANDAHQNVGLGIRWITENQGRLEDALGEKLLDIDLSLIPDSEQMRLGRMPGELIFSLYLDRYEYSLRHVATHLLLKELSETSVRECLDAGRCFVAFDWLADSQGFQLQLQSANGITPLGGRATFTPNGRLQGHSPLPCHWKILRNGTAVHEASGAQLDVVLDQPGVYRCEAWLNVAGTDMVWVLTNPIYVDPIQP
jgi:hypothetical protein